MAKEGEGRIQINMTLEENLQFIEKLAYDDDFRERLKANPEKVLREYNIEAPADTFPRPVRLPGKGELQKRVREYQELAQRDSRLGHVVFAMHIFLCFRPGSEED